MSLHAAAFAANIRLWCQRENLGFRTEHFCSLIHAEGSVTQFFFYYRDL